MARTQSVYEVSDFCSYDKAVFIMLNDYEAIYAIVSEEDFVDYSDVEPKPDLDKRDMILVKLFARVYIDYNKKELYIADVDFSRYTSFLGTKITLTGNSVKAMKRHLDVSYLLQPILMHFFDPSWHYHVGVNACVAIKVLKKAIKHVRRGLGQLNYMIEDLIEEVAIHTVPWVVNGQKRLTKDDIALGSNTIENFNPN